MCLRRRFSQHAFLAHFHILGPTSDANFPHFPHVSDHCTKNLGFFGRKSWFSQDLFSSDAKCPRFSTFLPLLHEQILSFAHDLSSFDATFPTFFHVLAPLHQQILVFHRICSLLMQKFPTFFKVSSSDAKFPTGCTSFVLL